MRKLLTALTYAMAGLSAFEPVHAQAPPVLDFPVDCRIGEDCWIFSFVDLDTGPTYSDHRCGARTYEAHKGTDIALTDARAAYHAVPVRAAANGIVVGLRDGVPDNELGEEPTGNLGQECGNGVRLHHGGGWYTQYCHLQRSSVRVNRDDVVAAGDVLGLVGNSGGSETPHLHFQVSRDRTIIDPFTGREPSDAPQCGAGQSMWSDAALGRFGAYEPSLIRNAGFAVAAPTRQAAQTTPPPVQLPGNRPALYLYAILYGALEGSSIRFKITGPDGTVLINTAQSVPRNKARQFQYAGKKTPAGGWPPGLYHGEVSVTLPPEHDRPPYVTRAEVTIR